MASLENKVIIMTGTSSGIGAYTAPYLAKYKPKLVLVARRKEKLEDVAKKCQEKGLPADKILVLPADLSKQDDLKRIISETVAKFGQIDVLVNNAAAFSGMMMGVDGYTPDDFDKTTAVNLKAPIFLSQAAVPYLKKTKGSIINISSTASTQAVPAFTLYSVSKAGLDHFTRCLARELAPFDVRVNSVRPGFIMTDNFANTPPPVVEKILARVKENQPLKGAGECEDVAKVIKFLASDDASFISGESIYVDGAGHLVEPSLKFD